MKDPKPAPKRPPRWVMPTLILSVIMLVAALGIMLFAQWREATGTYTESDVLPRLSSTDDASYGKLKGVVVPMAKRLLEKRGTFALFAAGVDNGGQVTLLADDVSGRGIGAQLRTAFATGRFAAVATCSASGEPVDAIVIHLETASDARSGTLGVKRDSAGEVSFGITTVEKVQRRYAPRR